MHASLFIVEDLPAVVLCAGQAQAQEGGDKSCIPHWSAWLIIRTFSANEYYFSLTTNQPTVFSAMTYQPNEEGYLTQNKGLCASAHHSCRTAVSLFV